MYNTHYHRIPIHVKPHVAKYITSVYGNKIIISAENPATMVLYGFLQKKTQSLVHSKNEIKKRIHQQNKLIYLYIQKRDIYNHGIFINDKNHVLISLFFEKEITSLIYHIAQAYQQIKRSRKAAIEYFCTQHNIEIDEDITIDALTKADQRFALYLQKIKQQNDLASEM